MAQPQVRFDDLCVLIPRDSPSPTPGSPRIVTKTYQLWGAKNKGHSSDDDDLLDTGNCLLTIPCLAFKVPSLSRKAKQPLYRHSDCQPAQSCLSHGKRTSRAHRLAQCALSSNEKSASQPTLHTPAMVHVSHPSSSPSTPSASSSTSHAYHNPQRQLRHRSSSSQLLNQPSLITVPLRDCCPDCVHSVEAAFLDTYSESWSAGAVKRHASDATELGMKQVGCTILANKMKRGRGLQRSEESALLMAKRTLSDSSAGDDDDDEDLFPLPSPRRGLGGSPGCMTPTFDACRRQSAPANPSVLSAALNAKIASATRTSSPSRPTAKIASTTRITPNILAPPPRHPSRMESPPPSGRELLALCPDVDVLPPQTRGRSPSTVSTASSGSGTGLMGRTRSGSTSRGRDRSESGSGMSSLSRQRSNSSTAFTAGNAIAKSVGW